MTESAALSMLHSKFIKQTHINQLVLELSRRETKVSWSRSTLVLSALASHPSLNLAAAKLLIRIAHPSSLLPLADRKDLDSSTISALVALKYSPLNEKLAQNKSIPSSLRAFVGLSGI
jgi:hypothetical protein